MAGAKRKEERKRFWGPEFVECYKKIKVEQEAKAEVPAPILVDSPQLGAVEDKEPEAEATEGAVPATPKRLVPPI